MPLGFSNSDEAVTPLQEEDKIIIREVETLKAKMPEREVPWVSMNLKPPKHPKRDRARALFADVNNCKGVEGFATIPDPTSVHPRPSIIALTSISSPFQKKMKEFLVRLLYVEMLGHDGSFGYIYAVNLTSSRVLLEKRTGYLTVSLCLHEDHELILLLISNIQRVILPTTPCALYLDLTVSVNLIRKSFE